MGAVPVDATLNVAVWPAVIVTLPGCVVIVGATAVLAEVPVPLSATENVEPFERVNSKVPE